MDYGRNELNERGGIYSIVVFQKSSRMECPLSMLRLLILSQLYSSTFSNLISCCIPHDAVISSPAREWTTRVGTVTEAPLGSRVCRAINKISEIVPLDYDFAAFTDQPDPSKIPLDLSGLFLPFSPAQKGGEV